MGIKHRCRCNQVFGNCFGAICAEVIPTFSAPPRISRWQQLPGCWRRSLCSEELEQLSAALPFSSLLLSLFSSAHPPGTTRTVGGSRKKDFSYFFVTPALDSIFLLMAAVWWSPLAPMLLLGAQPCLGFRPARSLCQNLHGIFHVCSRLEASAGSRGGCCH